MQRRTGTSCEFACDDASMPAFSWWSLLPCFDRSDPAGEWEWDGKGMDMAKGKGDKGYGKGKGPMGINPMAMNMMMATRPSQNRERWG